MSKKIRLRKIVKLTREIFDLIISFRKCDSIDFLYFDGGVIPEDGQDEHEQAYFEIDDALRAELDKFTTISYEEFLEKDFKFHDFYLIEESKSIVGYLECETFQKRFYLRQFFIKEEYQDDETISCVFDLIEKLPSKSVEQILVMACSERSKKAIMRRDYRHDAFFRKNTKT